MLLRVIVTLGIIILLTIVTGAALIYSGVVSVAAKEPHYPLVRRFLQTAKLYSVQHHTDGDVKAPHLNDPSLIRAGYEHYRETCLSCHGAPGVPPSDVGKGLRPSPPELAKDVYPWTDTELFWIIDNGIKMTGMPALGLTHSREELWAIVAFVKKLPHMTPEEYQSFDDHDFSNRDHHSSNGHSH